MHIRQETKADYQEVYALIQSAFQTVAHSDKTEQDLVAALRDGPAFIKELSLVAEKDGKLVGYILFTKIKIGNQTELALAPLAVLPDYQKKGIGTALIKQGHAIAKMLGYHCAVVLGSPHYYPRAGYRPANGYGIFAPFDVPPENFMVCAFDPSASLPSGVVQYAPEFGISQ